MATGLSLIVMAAGMGSRYGGLKQLDPVGPRGEFIIDYSVHDAMKAGFEKAVFVIRKDFEGPFREQIGRRLEGLMDTEYVFQALDDLPSGHRCPAGREKPWGTSHAVLCCRSAVKSPFAVINADDYYGPSSFQVLGNYLESPGKQPGTGEYCMVGFRLENTLTENGPVARGICSVDSDGFLREIQERTNIQRFDDGVRYTEDGETWVTIPAGSTVSMNAWGFTPDIFHALEEGFSRFLDADTGKNLKAEYYLPTAVGELVSAGKARVRVLSSGEKWYGMTYPGDKPVVRQAIMDMIEQKRYPEVLWGDPDGSAAG
ncbi:MAG: nucleotidyltransferase [Spirochaetales bacterium]|nr:nucleotidyltransferase [Spirochaetales bacterium]